MDDKNRIISYMNRSGIDYTVLDHQRSESLLQTAMICGLDPAAIAQAVFLDNSRGPIMAVIPLSHAIRLDWIESFTRLKTDTLELDESARIFSDCEPGSIPPVAIPYGLQAIIDSSLRQQPEIYFRPGRYDQLIKINNKNFFAMHRYSIQGNIAERIRNPSSQSIRKSTPPRKADTSPPVHEMGDSLNSSVAQLKELPAMPDTALKLLPIHGNPDADFQTLAEIIELDASLSAQLLHYANSAYFPHHSEITNIEDAIRHSIGFDTALNLSIAISVSKSFNIPKDGPIGLLANWGHSIFSAALCKELVSLIPQPHNLDGATAYLAGLLHDIGFFVLGHLRKAKFNQLNAAIKARPDAPIILLEQKILGTNHSTLGAALLKKWGLPEALIIATKEHHNIHYAGKHHLYPALIRLGDHLLKHHDLSDATGDDLSHDLCELLNIDREQATAVTEKLMQQTHLFEELSLMVSG